MQPKYNLYTIIILNNTVSVSVAARRVWASCFYPSVMKYLPVLLPWQFLYLLDWSTKVPMPLAADGADAKVDKEDRRLAKLEEIIKTVMWKLGFSRKCVAVLIYNNIMTNLNSIYCAHFRPG